MLSISFIFLSFFKRYLLRLQIFCNIKAINVFQYLMLISEFQRTNHSSHFSCAFPQQNSSATYPITLAVKERRGLSQAFCTDPVTLRSDRENVLPCPHDSVTLPHTHLTECESCQTTPPQLSGKFSWTYKLSLENTAQMIVIFTFEKHLYNFFHKINFSSKSIHFPRSAFFTLIIQIG